MGYSAAERGVNCEHLQALVTNIYTAALWQAWMWKTNFDVAKPPAVSKILTLTGVHGHLTVALLAEMQDVRGSASFEDSETEFRYSRCIRQGGVEAPVLWERCSQVCAVEKLKKSGEPKVGSCLSEDSMTMSLCCVG